MVINQLTLKLRCIIVLECHRRLARPANANVQCAMINNDIYFGVAEHEAISNKFQRHNIMSNTSFFLQVFVFCFGFICFELIFILNFFLSTFIVFCPIYSHTNLYFVIVVVFFLSRYVSPSRYRSIHMCMRFMPIFYSGLVLFTLYYVRILSSSVAGCVCVCVCTFVHLLIFTQHIYAYTFCLLLNYSLE